MLTSGRIYLLTCIVVVCMVNSLALSVSSKTASRKPKELDINRLARTADLVTKGLAILSEVKWAAIASTVGATVLSHLTTIWSGIQYVGIAYGIIYLIFTVASWLFPSLYAIPLSLGLSPTIPLFRSLKSTVAEMDVGRMMRALESLDLTESSFQYLEIPEPQCQNRAVCELGEYMANDYPIVTRFIGLAASVTPSLHSYSVYLRNTTEHPHCQQIFADCDYSPLEKLRYRWLNATS
ncbi:uncharacterized protein LOC106464473 isoform X2 [Limulus polyphemus]|uniref:Uncharacterized protein LOC106464473 isoform X2 n=1 Tax=Limulus polyphemus TaxID=6850 RepID=A0ABM1SW99_LIMPO|nr:uncharacterized protein LOC106464473 isoform X2 [Limulus polyphemus]